MVATTKPFLALTAADLMSRELVMVPREMSLRAAAHMLSQAAITGAPVVDSRGRCVGVLSSSDFVRWAEGEESADRPPYRPRGAVCSEWQMMDPDQLPTTEVGEYMTTDPVTVAPAAPIGELARRMIDAHIHRLIVVDREGMPIGVVSTTDILAAVAYTDSRPF
jgi:CBS domain-containing protein